MADRSARFPVLPVRIPDGIVVFSGAVAIALAAGLAGGCTEQRGTDASRIGAGSIEVVDDVGRTVRLRAPATRIVSLIPARTDVLLALGAADRLVARTVYDRDPRLADLPSLGDALTPSVEWLLARQPDLVIAWPDRQTRTIIERLQGAGIAVYASQVETIDELRTSIAHIGVLVGLETAATALLDRIDTAIEQVRALADRRERRSVAYFIGLDPPMAAGPGTFMDELIAIAGGTNVFSDAASRWPAVSLEEVIERRPAVVIVATGQAGSVDLVERLRRSPGWRVLEAVRAGRVHVVDPDLFNRPGPGLIEAVHLLARVIGAP